MLVFPRLECYPERMLLTDPTIFDLGISNAVQRYQPDWLVIIAKCITSTAQPVIIVPLAVFFIIVLYLQNQSRYESLLLWLMAGNLLTIVLKPIVQRVRPLSSHVHILVHETGFSFPSGHAVASVLIAAVIWELFRARRSKLLLVILLFYVLAVGWSRIYLGVHWATDVLAGYGVALLWVFIVYLVLPDLFILGPKRRKQKS